MPLALRAALLLLLVCGTAQAQDDRDEEPASDEPTVEEDGERFVIPPDAMSPLRRDPVAAPKAGRAEPTERVPEILRDESALPAPVRRMRELIRNAARTGDIEKLRPLLGAGDTATQLTFDALETDPISFLLAASGDPEGHEVLAILLEVLEAGFVRTEDETDGVLYVWPYFAAFPIKELEPAMKVELFRLLTGGDYEDMQEFGAYIFYRVGITESGEWRFFLSGDG